MIKNESNIECQNINQNFDDDFFIPKNYCIGEDPEHNELIDMPVDLNKHNLSFQNDKNIKYVVLLNVYIISYYIAWGYMHIFEIK